MGYVWPHTINTEQEFSLIDSFEKIIKKYNSENYNTEGLTLGCTSYNVHCTTVHFAQVSNRNSRKFSDSDHAALVTNMTSDSGFFSRKGRCIS